jgi:hypothetical protein
MAEARKKPWAYGFMHRRITFSCPDGVCPRSNHEIRFAGCQAIFRNRCVTNFGFVKFGAKTQSHVRS